MKKIIKKYKNRRLYDTDISKYVTLDDLKSYVLENESFDVVDASNGRDLTNIILLQILVEQGSESNQFLSEALLKNLIILAEKPMHEAFQRVLEQMLISVQQNKVLHEFNKTNGEMNQQAKKLFHEWLAFFDKSL